MAREYKLPEYQPYPSGPPSPITGEEPETGFIPTRAEIISYLREDISKLEGLIIDVQAEIAKRSIVNTGKDELLQSVLGDVWDTGTEIPLAIYEKASVSENAKHLYISEVALKADRSISGSYALDKLDVFNLAIKEAKAMLAWLEVEGSLKDEGLVSSALSLEEAIYRIYELANLPNQYREVDGGFFVATSNETDPTRQAAAIQKEIHRNLGKLSEVLIQNKSNLQQIAETSSAFYSERLYHLDTGYGPDTNVMAKLMNQRAALLADSANNVFRAITTGDALKEEWQKKASETGITPDLIAQQAYISQSPSNLASGSSALEGFEPERLPALSDGGVMFIRKQGYDHEDSDAVIAILNSLPENSTLIRGGVVAVRGSKSLDDTMRNLNETLSWFGITDTTLIDGSKILTGGVLVDTLLSGLSTVGDAAEVNIEYGETATIALDKSYRLREIRSVDSYSYPIPLIWPTIGAASLKYKIALSINGTDWEWVRGDASNWTSFSRSSYTDRNGNLMDTPLVIIIEGNYAKYVRITFGGFYDEDDNNIIGNLACNLQIFGAAAYIDGGSMFANSIAIGKLSPTLQSDIIKSANAATNFDDRNDRNPDIPNAPVFVHVEPDRVQNSDGSINFTVSWDY